MKASAVLIIATFFTFTLGWLKVSGQPISSTENVKNNEFSAISKSSETVKSVSVATTSRKAVIQITIDGKSFKSGDIITVKPGQKIMMGAEMVGGRRDYCKFPDTDNDIAGVAEILSRGENGISYQINGVKSEWKLINEDPQFTTDKFLQVKPASNKPTTEITITNDKFSQTFLKIAIKTSWVFTRNGETKLEVNSAEETVYFQLAGVSDVWFLTQNIQASGIKNDLVKEKLNDIQSAFDSIETNFYRLNFTALQQSNRNLQHMVSSLKSTIDEVKASNPSYQAKILFIGLPSDIPYNDISVFSVIQSNWDTLEAMLNDQKERLGKLPVQPTKESNEELVKIITGFVNWQQKLPESTLKVLTRYIPDLKSEKIQLPENFYAIAKGKIVSDYSKELIEYIAFLDQRIQQIPDEILKINSVQARLQAVKLFDGMLRSYVSSIYWADWKNTRESELLTLSLKDNL
jgi:hypothetical protein